MFKITPSSLPATRQANTDKKTSREPRYGVNSNVRRTAKEHQANRFMRNTKLSKYYREATQTNQARQLMLQNIQPKMLPQSHLVIHNEAATALMDKRIKDLENCVSSQDIPKESEWGNLPRVSSRHEVEEAKRLAKLINPKRWREVFLGYCTVLLALRSARPKRWIARDDNLAGHWFYQPWFRIDSSEQTKNFSAGLQLGFTNFISQKVMLKPTVLTVDFASEKWKHICEPESLSNLLQVLGESFNRGTLGCFVKNSDACPTDVVALLRLFIRRCSDKGVILTEQAVIERKHSSRDKKSFRRIKGSEFISSIGAAVRNEDASELIEKIERASGLTSWRHAVCATLEEQDEAHLALSLFSLFMTPTIPVVTSLVKPKANSQAANILRFFNASSQTLPALSSQKVIPVTAECSNIFSVIKLGREGSQTDVVLVTNFANYASEVTIPLQGRYLQRPRTIHAGDYEQAVQSASPITHTHQTSATFLVPPRGVLVAELAPKKSES